MRQERLAAQIQTEVADMLRNQVKDPRIGFASILKVELSGDLRVARIHVSVLGDERARKDTLEGLESAKGFIRTELGRRLHLRFTPEIRFVIDRGIEHGDRIARLLNELRPGAAPASGGAGGAGAPGGPAAGGGTPGTGDGGA